jgi:hypothetical protein
MIVFGVAVAVVLLVAQAALAVQIHDPKDTGGKLDLETVNATRQGHALSVAVTTYGTWPSSLLAHSGGNRIKVLFDTDNDGTAEYIGSIVDLQGNLNMIIRGQGSEFEPIPVTRPDDNTALVKVPGDFAANPVHAYQLAVKSVFVPASGPTKVDRAPNTGWIAIPHAS